ncbi:hypothetical protein [Actinomadura monticuli]|uniref:Uncharacterized protein n=1 Tax=Actinomadura monticuli TaxID=3097367 RepID=A0ABV4QEJ0_9ACTN
MRDRHGEHRRQALPRDELVRHQAEPERSRRTRVTDRSDRAAFEWDADDRRWAFAQGVVRQPGGQRRHALPGDGFVVGWSVCAAFESDADDRRWAFAQGVVR